MIAPWKYFDCTESTNKYLIELSDNEILDGYTCSTGIQTAGRGRNGRSWNSPPGGLYMSILFLPSQSPHTWGLMSLGAAIGIAEALEITTPDIQVYLKWPNDLIVNGKKVGGLLLQTALKTKPRLVVGVGINLFTDPMFLPERPLFPATSIHLESKITPDLKHVADVCREKLFEIYHKWQKDPKKIVSLWMKRSLSYGRSVTIKVKNRRLLGIDRGLDIQGNLLLETADGIESLSSADIVDIYSD